MNPLLLNKFKTKTDISFVLCNVEPYSKQMNIWDGICDEYPDKETIPSVINVGSIIFRAWNNSFFECDNYIKLGDKKYKLSHYLKDGVCIIYDFSGGWLCPLNIKVNTFIAQYLNIQPHTSVTISISVV